MSNNGGFDTLHYSDYSSIGITNNANLILTTHPMTAHPAYNPATITVNKFDTSLPQGNILIDFTADTTDGNNVIFTVHDLLPNHYYLIKKDGLDFTALQANSSGYIQFSNSKWSQHTFTIEETSSPSGTLLPIAIAGLDRIVTAGENFLLDGSASSDDNGIVSYIWDFDDSNGFQQDAIGAVVNHIYDTAGTYTVTLTVTDTNGSTDSDTAAITVQDPSKLPIENTQIIDNRLRESAPDSVLSDSTWIDVGRIDSAGNYRSTIWFDLSQFNSTDHVEQATLSLFWYYESRNQSTDVGIYRPANWDADYVTWNTRTVGTTWNNPGGDWYDRNNVAQGATPYATVALPVDTPPDYMYHDFDVTDLVQSYVNGTYENTGFFIKANEIDNSYIAFYSSDWSNASQRPKLSITHTPEDGPINHAPVLTPIGPQSTSTGSLLQFTITATDPDSDPLTYSTGILPGGAAFNSTTRTFSWIPGETQAGTYTVHFEVTDGSLTDAEDVTITVNETDTTPPVITNVISSNITSSNIAIYWTTDEPATSQIEYGLDTNYGSKTNLDSSLVTTHSDTITGLTNNTAYHYRVKSIDASDNPAVSGGYTFITLPISTGTGGLWHFDEGIGGIVADSS
ncbi:MAG: DNRLRE domain-containing protein, partial [ANME-2 cluster archaeon]|nr:DNRLRE domain-containing protein [ANME-2 cluster archaeon]